MKVLWISHVVPYPPKAGVLLRSYHLVHELAKHVELDLVCFVQEAWLKLCFPSVEEGLAESKRELNKFCNAQVFLDIPSDKRRYGQVRLALASLTGDPCYTVRWLRTPEATQAIGALAGNGYGVVHFDTISLAQYRPLFKGTPATLGHHNIESHMLLRRTEFEPNPLRKLYYRQEGHRLERYERKVAPWFDAHMTCSAIDGERWQEIAPGSKIWVVPNGVDTSFFEPDAGPVVPNTFIFVATMDIYSNADAMRFFTTEVWPLLKARRPDVTLGIAGRNPPQWLRTLAEQDPSIRVYGFVDDVRPYIRGAELYVCPVRDGGGTRLKVLDALSMGKCMVAHPIAAEGIEVTDGENIVFASQPDEFVNRIGELLDDKTKSRRIGQAGRELMLNQYDFGLLGRRMAEDFGAIAANAG